MLVLALDTSTPAVTAGVVEVTPLPEALDRAGVADAAVRATVPLESPATLLAERSVTDAFAHAEQLMPLATEALRECGHRLAEIDAVVVGLGPGPFTGLRVGIATAAALGDGLDVPVHGIPSHDGFAQAAGPASDFLVITDARRREIYLSAYQAGGRPRLGPMVLAPGAVAAMLAEQHFSPVAVVGPGTALLTGTLGLPVVPITGSLAAGLVVRALPPLLTGAVPGPLTPLYLRRPDAVEPTARKSVLR